MANETVQTVIVNDTFDNEFENLDVVLRIFAWLTALPDAEAVNELTRKNSRFDWITFSDTSVNSAIAVTTGDPEMSQALELWKARSEALKRRTETVAKWSELISNRRMPLAASLKGQTLTGGLVFELPSDCSVFKKGSQVSVEWQPGLGVIVSIQSEPFKSNEFGRPESLIFSSSDGFEIELKKPAILSTNYGGEFKVKIRCVDVVLNIRGAQPAVSNQYLMVSKANENIILDLDEVQNGDTEARLMNLNHDYRSIKFHSRSCEPFVFEPRSVRMFGQAFESFSISSATVTGQLAQFDIDLFQHFLFLSTGYQFRVFEKHGIGADGQINSITFPSYDFRPLAYVPQEKSGTITRAFLEEIFPKVCSLPTSSKVGLCSARFKVAVHALQLASGVPIQKAIVDLYQVLDTLSNVHQTTIVTEEEKKLLKRQKADQQRILNISKFMISSLNQPYFKRMISMLTVLPLNCSLKNMIKEIYAITDEDAIFDAIRNLIDKKNPGLSVVGRVKKLIESCGIIYNKADRIQRLALDLRHSISHDLASVTIPGDKITGTHSLDDLCAVRNLLIQWTRECIFSMLNPH